MIKTNLKVVKMQNVGIRDKADPDLRFFIFWVTKKHNKNNYM